MGAETIVATRDRWEMLIQRDDVVVAYDLMAIMRQLVVVY